mmetsp:Transcript_137259/g.347732  ORF Transcript_137259/g.347732 Transcript_137259/m.347732 type:complete len:276 (-) Transcript_137259:17-844(-)
MQREQTHTDANAEREAQVLGAAPGRPSAKTNLHGLTNNCAPSWPVEARTNCRCSGEVLREGRTVGLDDADNDSEEAERAAKNLNDEHLDEHFGPLCISESTAAARDADADATEEVREADGEANAEHAPTCHHGLRLPALKIRSDLEDQGALDLIRHDDRHDDAVDGNSLAEDDADQILGTDAGGLDTTANDAGAREEDAPSSADHGDTESESDAHVRPHVGAHGFKNAENRSLVARLLGEGLAHVVGVVVRRGAHSDSQTGQGCRVSGQRQNFAR